jgi:hypothetical protein
MLDEFPALGRLDFFKSALVFLADCGLKAFLIGGVRREPELPDHVAIVRETTNAPAHEEFDVIDDEPEDAARQARVLRQQMRGLARQASLDPADGLQP